MKKAYLLIIILTSILLLSGCYCGFNQNNADCYTRCSGYDQNSFSIDDYSKDDFGWDNVKLDTIGDTIQINYFIYSDEYLIILNLLLNNNEVEIDSINSYVQDKNQNNKFRFNKESFKVNQFILTENQCCKDYPNGCSYPMAPGTLTTEFESIITSESGTNKNLTLRIGFQTLAKEDCEC
ncbi:MAG: hypothetical protein ACJA2C_002850 [Marinoscillum sp.]|jgi:hypothetical protein